MATNTSNKNTIMGWVDRRLPVTENLERHLTKHPVPKKSKFLLSIWCSFNGCLHDTGHHRNLADDVLHKY